MGSWQTTWGFVPVITTELMHLTLLSTVLPKKVTALPLVFVKEKYTCPTLLIYSGGFNILLSVLLNSNHHLISNIIM